MKYQHRFIGFVTEDGTYGADHVLVFDFDEFIQKFPEAWEILDDMADNDKQDFARSVMDQDMEILQDFAIDYNFNIESVTL